MRTHIAKSLQTRCKAIQNAVKVYNTAATALSPPRPTIDWSKVSHYSFLDEFSLLRDTRQDVREQAWARPAHRETVRQYLRIQRAQEEILRCNVEIRRLHTAIIDEHQLFDIVQEDLKQGDSPMQGPVQEFILRRRRVNMHILARIQQTYCLPGFSGHTTVGTRKGMSVPTSTSDTRPPSVDEEIQAIQLDMDDELENDLENDDDMSGDIGGLVDYVTNLSMRD